MKMTRRDVGLLAVLAASGVGAPGALAGSAHADAGPQILELYFRFLAAQNARDLAGVRATLWDSPDFLWVSDGRTFWGPDALVERMAAFQRAEVWRVEPDLDRARAVDVTADAAYLSLPLVLVIGSQAAPARLPWLVGVLCRRQPEGWRIAALFTTEDKAA